MDIETLQERQRWTLEQKIDHAVATVESYIARTGKTPYVSFSGGKDRRFCLIWYAALSAKRLKAFSVTPAMSFPK